MRSQRAASPRYSPGEAKSARSSPAVYLLACRMPSGGSPGIPKEPAPPTGVPRMAAMSHCGQAEEAVRQTSLSPTQTRRGLSDRSAQSAIDAALAQSLLAHDSGNSFAGVTDGLDETWCRSTGRRSVTSLMYACWWVLLAGHRSKTFWDTVGRPRISAIPGVPKVAEFCVPNCIPCGTQALHSAS